MKHSKIYKIPLYLFLGAAVLFTSCSKDDDSNNNNPPGNNQNIDPPFEAGVFETDFDLPSVLESPSDPEAQDLVLKFEEATSFMDDSDIMEIPPGAEVSHEPITVGNPMPRGGSANVDYTVYTYSYSGGSIAYQFSVQNGMDVFELFVSTPETGYTKVFEITQNQAGTSGSMSFYFMGMPAQTWAWEINADGSVFITYETGVSGTYNMTTELTYNPDMSGSMEIFENGTLVMSFVWDNSGHGTATNHETGESVTW